MPKISLNISEKHMTAAHVLAEFYRVPTTDFLAKELESQIEFCATDKEAMGAAMEKRLTAILGKANQTA